MGTIQTRLRPARRSMILIGIVVLVCGLGLWGVQGLTQSPAPPPEPLLLDFHDFRNGDLLFRTGLGNLTRIVLAADRDALYSHVGLVWIEGDEVRVIHATPGESFTDPTPVQVDSLEHYLAPDHARAAAVVRLAGDPATAATATTVARNFADRGLLFDGDLDLDDDGALYCTELVWKAYLKAGVDLAETRLYRSQFLGDTPVLLPGGLLDSPHLNLVHQYRTEKGDP